MAAVSIDSLKQVWTNMAEADSNRFKAINTYYIEFGFADPDSILALSHYHYQLALEKRTRAQMAEALDNRAIAYYVMGIPDSAISQLQKAMVLVEKMRDTLGRARLYANIGTIHLEKDEFQEAVSNYSQSLEILKAKNKEFDQAEVLNNIGLVYYDIKRYDLALNFFEEALKLYRKLALEDKMGNIWLNIGSVYYEQKELELASPYTRKALSILQKTHNLSSTADCYHLLARIFQESGKKDSAWYYIQKSLPLNLEIGDESDILEDQILLAELQFESNVSKATKAGEALLASAEASSRHSLKASVYELLYSCYKEQGNYEQALQMHEAYSRYQDSVQLEENEITLIREAMQSQYEFKLLEKEFEYEQAQTQQRLRQVKERYAIVLISILLIGGILLYSRSRILAQRKQAQKLLTQIEQLKNSAKTAANLHPNGFQLDKAKIEQAISRKVNETDWKVLNILLNDPVISNKGIAEEAFVSIDGIGSSLKRMYEAFEIKESRYKKISLIMEAMKISN